MKPFTYTAAESEKGACQLLGKKALPLAGGTNLLSLMKEYVLEPDVLVDIKTIPGMAGIESTGGGVKIGANTTFSELLASGVIENDYPALRQAVYDSGTPQSRNRGTLGGDLCVRPACWYFSKRSFSCAKSGGEGCPAKEGENEYHAIFDTDGPCVMVHASSTGAALLALGAKVRVAGPTGDREISLGDFFASPGEDIERENSLADNEIVTHVLLGEAQRKSASYAVSLKAGNDWPLCTASVSLDLAGGVCRGARVYLGSVAPVPYHAARAERALVGKSITEEVAEAAGVAAVEGAKPLSQNAYKVASTRAAVKRALLLAAHGKWR